MIDDPPRILVVDDEANICRTCVKALSKKGYRVGYALNGYDALKIMERTPADVVVTDLKMSSLGGMEVLRRVRETYPDTVVVIITGYSTVSSAVEVMKMGAFDYLPKPFTPDELRAVVEQAVGEHRHRQAHRRLQQPGSRPKPVVHQLVGESRQIRRVISMVQKVAPTDSTVLIQGESGTGKELIARAIHANSMRKAEVFFAVDCGTLSDNLLESELFGHLRGAFTGAHADKEGIFQKADGGTVFLDEISNVSLPVQGKLLRFIEAREFIPVGGSSPRKVRIRLIFATNRNLDEMVSEGQFREDFYYRIYVYPILLPPLRDRKADILPIAYHFLRQFAQRMGKPIRRFSADAAGRLEHFDWPGNVRQLRNAVERAVILCEKDTVSLRDLPVLDAMADIAQLVEHVPSTNDELKRIKKTIRQKAVQKVERNFLMNALSKSDWNITQAAQAVGLQRTNFQAMMKKYRIKRPKSDGGGSDA